MPSLNVKIGASVDRNLQVAFRPLVEAAKKAKSAIEAESKQAGRAISRETKKGVDEAERKFRELEAEVMSDFPKAMKTAGGAAAAFGKEAKASFASAKKSFNDLAREAENALAKVEKSQKKIAGMSFGQKAAGLWDRAGGNAALFTGPASSGFSRGGRAALGIGKAAAGAAFHLAGSLARAGGVDTDIGSIFKKNFDLEKAATDLSSSGFMAGDARNGKRVDPSELMRETLAVGTRTGTDAGEVMGGLQKFVGLTGDLKTGRETMEDLLKLSKATGTSFEDMAAAAANVSNVLPDTADKAQLVKATMQAIAGQGKLGAVEIKDLAGNMAKLAASAGSYEGNKVQTVADMGVLAQAARGKGGAASPAQAVTSVQRFTDTFDKAAREKAFAHFGVDVRGKSGGLLASDTIIKNALVAAESHGGMGRFKHNMGQMFASTEARNVTRGFEQIYMDAGGGKAGVAAVTAEFERLRNAAMSTAEVEESFARSMKTGNSQAQVFNNQMQKTALEMQTALLPAVQALAPEAVKAAQAFSQAATFLLGVDAKKNVDESMDKANSTLESAKKQVRGNQISEATKDDLAKSEFDMKSAAALAQSDLNDAEKNKTGAAGEAFYKAIDWIPAMQGINLLGGGGIGDGVGHAKLDRENVDLQTKRWTADEAQQKYQEIAQANRELRALLASGQVKVIVGNINELKSVGGPGVDPSGRQPSPDEKARDR